MRLMLVQNRFHTWRKLWLNLTLPFNIEVSKVADGECVSACEQGYRDHVSENGMLIRPCVVHSTL